MGGYSRFALSYILEEYDYSLINNMPNNQYKNLVIAGVVFLSIGSLFLAAKTLSALKSLGNTDGQYAQTVPPQISVTGTGDMSAIPDIASFYFTVTGSAKTVQDAQAQATSLTNKALAYLKNAGIDDKDIQTQGYNINPKYENQPVTVTAPVAAGAPNSGSVGSAPVRCYDCGSTQVVVGYEVTQTISVKVRKTDKAGTVLAGIGSLGVQNVSGLSLTIDDETALTAQARAKAITDAKTKAQALASQLGVHLGKILSFSDSSGGYYPMAYAAKGMALDSAAVPAPSIPTGENKITSNVTITFEIN